MTRTVWGHLGQPLCICNSPHCKPCQQYLLCVCVCVCTNSDLYFLLAKYLFLFVNILDRSTHCMYLHANTFAKNKTKPKQMCTEKHTQGEYCWQSFYMYTDTEQHTVTKAHIHFDPSPKAKGHRHCPLLCLWSGQHRTAMLLLDKARLPAIPSLWHWWMTGKRSPRLSECVWREAGTKIESSHVTDTHSPLMSYSLSLFLF